MLRNIPIPMVYAFSLYCIFNGHNKYENVLLEFNNRKKKHDERSYHFYRDFLKNVKITLTRLIIYFAQHLKNRDVKGKEPASREKSIHCTQNLLQAKIDNNMWWIYSSLGKMVYSLSNDLVKVETFFSDSERNL